MYILDQSIATVIQSCGGLEEVLIVDCGVGNPREKNGVGNK